MTRLGIGQMTGIPTLLKESYQQWGITVKSLLITQNAWGIVTGEETEPKAPAKFQSEEEEESFRKNIRDFKSRNAKATSIIYRATPWEYSSHISEMTDPKAMWEKLANLFEFKRNPLLVYKYHQAFHDEKFGEKDTIRSWANRLRTHARKLESSDWPLDPRDIVHKLLRDLPDEYEVIRQLLYEEGPQKLQFDTVVRILQTTANIQLSQNPGSKRERSPAPEPPAPLKRRCAKTMRWYERKLNGAKARQERILAFEESSLKEEKEQVVEDRIEKPQTPQRHCSICCLPDHTESDCPHREHGTDVSSSNIGQITSPNPFDPDDMEEDWERPFQSQAQDNYAPSTAAEAELQTQ